MKVYKVTRAELTVHHRNGVRLRVEDAYLTSLWTSREKAIKHALWHTEDFSFIAEQNMVAKITGDPIKNVYVRVDEYKEDNGRLVLSLNGTTHVAEVEEEYVTRRIEK